MSLAFANHRDHVDRLVAAALAAADPERAVRKYVRRQDQAIWIGDQPLPATRGQLLVISVGKAALAMTRGLNAALGDRITAGVVIAKSGSPGPGDGWPGQLALYFAGHPVSDEAGVRATVAVEALLADTTAEDVVLCLVSGGASALLTRPLLPLTAWQALIEALLASGCDINELNLIRRQLDLAKGGGLARWAAPAVCFSLILSDVIGNPLAMIGSGPTVPSGTPAADARAALALLRRYDIPRRLSPDSWAAIARQLEEGSAGGGAEDDRPPTHHVIVGDIRSAAEAALEAARSLGFTGQILSTQLEGEAREVGRVMAALARDAAPETCLLLGGETTVTVRGSGQGGRNQELALGAALGLAGPGATASRHQIVAGLATDGEDRLTGVAGAIATDQTVASARRLGLDPYHYLEQNDSFTFFSQLGAAEPASGSLIERAPSGTNVNDLVLILTYNRP